MTVAARMSFAFDLRGERDPERDDWVIENVGYIPKDVLPEFLMARYENAVTVYVMDSNT